MPTLDVDAVRLIIDTEVEDDAIEGAYIPMAVNFVADHLGSAGLSAATTFEIERLLTAHFLSATRDIEAGAIIEYRADTVTTRVGGALGGKVFGPGLKMTRFGQLALELDPSGILASIAEGKPEAGIDVVELPDPNAGATT